MHQSPLSYQMNGRNGMGGREKVANNRSMGTQKGWTTESDESWEMTIWNRDEWGRILLRKLSLSFVYCVCDIVMISTRHINISNEQRKPLSPCQVISSHKQFNHQSMSISQKVTEMTRKLGHQQYQYCYLCVIENFQQNSTTARDHKFNTMKRIGKFKCANMFSVLKWSNTVDN